jgi:hypothetical protein
MKHLLIAVILIACTSNYTHSQKATVYISDGFMKGQDYLDMDAAQKRAYAMGVVNGMLLAPAFDAPEEKVDWLRTCAVNMSDEQVAAILTKYLRDNPAQWHYRLNTLSLNAMTLACKHALKS